jgi:hypothetical protein
MESDNEQCTPPEITEAAKTTKLSLLPEKSRKKYEATLANFMTWRNQKNITSFSEDVLLVYFDELSEKYQSSSLWAHYSMLRSTLDINSGIKIENYSKLRAFLKRKSEGYTPKKAATFTPAQIKKFMNEAPDQIYLATKVRKS